MVQISNLLPRLEHCVNALARDSEPELTALSELVHSAVDEKMFGGSAAENLLPCPEEPLYFRTVLPTVGPMDYPYRGTSPIRKRPPPRTLQ